MKARSILLIAGVLSLSSGASAIITQYGITKMVFYRQNSAAQPAAELGSYFQANIYANTDGDIDSGTVSTPSYGLQDFIAYDFGKAMVYYSQVYSTEAQMETEFPDTNYLFSVTSGNTAPSSTVVNLISSSFATSVPYLNGTSYDDLQLCLPGAPLTVTFPTFTNNGLVPLTESYFTVVDMTSTATAHADYGPANTITSSTLPGSSLKSGHRYFYDLTSYSYGFQNNMGFGGAQLFQSFLRQTTGFFRTATLPGTVAGKVFFLDSYTAPLEPFDVEILDSNGNVLESISSQVGYENNYAFDTTVTGVRDIRFRGRHWISRIIPNVDLSVGQPDVDVSLINGDIDGDNAVTPSDYGIWALNNGSSVPAHTMGDIDGDGEVTPSDYGVWAINNGSIGD